MTRRKWLLVAALVSVFAALGLLVLIQAVWPPPPNPALVRGDGQLVVYGEQSSAQLVCALDELQVAEYAHSLRLKDRSWSIVLTDLAPYILLRGDNYHVDLHPSRIILQAHEEVWWPYETPITSEEYENLSSLVIGLAENGERSHSQPAHAGDGG